MSSFRPIPRLLLRVNEELQSSSVGSVATLAVAEDLDAKIETLLNTATQ